MLCFPSAFYGVFIHVIKPAPEWQAEVTRWRETSHKKQIRSFPRPWAYNRDLHPALPKGTEVGF